LLEEIKEYSVHQIEEFGEWEMLDFPDKEIVLKRRVKYGTILEYASQAVKFPFRYICSSVKDAANKCFKEEKGKIPLKALKFVATVTMDQMLLVPVTIVGVLYLGMKSFEAVEYYYELKETEKEEPIYAHEELNPCILNDAIRYVERTPFFWKLLPTWRVMEMIKRGYTIIKESEL
jgi:hypothetical protein